MIKKRKFFIGIFFIVLLAGTTLYLFLAFHGWERIYFIDNKFSPKLVNFFSDLTLPKPSKNSMQYIIKLQFNDIPLSEMKGKLINKIRFFQLRLPELDISNNEMFAHGFDKIIIRSSNYQHVSEVLTVLKRPPSFQILIGDKYDRSNDKMILNQTDLIKVIVDLRGERPMLIIQIKPERVTQFQENIETNIGKEFFGKVENEIMFELPVGKGIGGNGNIILTSYSKSDILAIAAMINEVLFPTLYTVEAQAK